MRRPRLLAALLALAGCSGRTCIDGGATCWASREDIVAMASRCHLPDFRPTPAGDVWAAYVPASVADHQARENCIYDGLRRQGLLVTR